MSSASLRGRPRFRSSANQLSKSLRMIAHSRPILTAVNEPRRHCRLIKLVDVPAICAACVTPMISMRGLYHSRNGLGQLLDTGTFSDILIITTPNTVKWIFGNAFALISYGYIILSKPLYGAKSSNRISAYFVGCGNSTSTVKRLFFCQSQGRKTDERIAME